MAYFSGLDFETFGGVDLRKHGLDRYVKHPSFQPLIACMDHGVTGHTYDFVFGGALVQQQFAEDYIKKAQSRILVAHNAGFERAVLNWLGIDEWLWEDMIDSAVVARGMGAGSSLESAGPQLTDTAKLETGKHLIQKFSVPNEWNGGKAPTKELILADAKTVTEWDDFKRYCMVDAQIGRQLAVKFDYHPIVFDQRHYEKLTARMNRRGWKVDLDLVREMQLRYEQNVDQAIADFRNTYDKQGQLNLGSSMQLKNWCEERGIKAKSFDVDHVDKLKAAVSKKLGTMRPDDPKYKGYEEVEAMLLTKQILGGSSLKKLQTILDTTGPDGRLRDQYIHVGAGQTHRTSGRSVQMQNLKRLGNHMLDDMAEVYDPAVELSNDALAENLRQVFTASQPDGQLIVGDFSSVESRALAYLAGADWKLDAYRKGQDMYKVLASKIYAVDYAAIDKKQRQTGKLGELSCGYGAGPVAVNIFSQGMGLDMSEEDALRLVRDWRAINPEIVKFWDQLDNAMHRAVETRQTATVMLPNRMALHFYLVDTPVSLQQQHPGAQSIQMQLDRNGVHVLDRMFHGCYVRGRNVCYYKPSERKSGPLWSSHFVDQKTKKTRFYDVYGGKLAGILTQSFCRELFFRVVRELERKLEHMPERNAWIIGQFHDEIVVDWWPITGGTTLERVVMTMDNCMTNSPFDGFPLAAEIKWSYRYTK